MFKCLRLKQLNEGFLLHVLHKQQGESGELGVPAV
jgi:hypothetical protein